MIRALINLLNYLRGRVDPSPYVGLTDLSRLTLPKLWPAHNAGECCTCGHDWQRGELVGLVTQAYVRRSDGTVTRRPGQRLACGACCERQYAEGDPSVQWAREAGLR